MIPLVNKILLEDFIDFAISMTALKPTGFDVLPSSIILKLFFEQTVLMD